MKCSAVIGANFGDEGKGSTVNNLCIEMDSAIVVRYNGGSQAGHTVIFDGIRHVFSHFGAGTLQGTPTYLSEFFVCDPTSFVAELNDLSSKMSLTPGGVIVHPGAIITTPYDIMYSWALEAKRGKDKHGSCGKGQNETIIRNESDYHFTVGKLLNMSTKECFDYVLSIRDEYYEKRINDNDMSDFINDNDFYSKSVINQYVYRLIDFLSYVKIENYDYLSNYENLIFEGAQGLCLDEDHHYFPHVTRSKTGLVNIEKIMNKLNINEIDVYYVTRAYVTRHGAGPLPFETQGKIYPNIEDETNITNQFQDHLRYAPLNFDMIFENVIKDIESVSLNVIKRLVMTCLDQVPDKINVVYDNEILSVSKDDLKYRITDFDVITGINNED